MVNLNNSKKPNKKTNKTFLVKWKIFQLELETFWLLLKKNAENKNFIGLIKGF